MMRTLYRAAMNIGNVPAAFLSTVDIVDAISANKQLQNKVYSTIFQWI